MICDRGIVEGPPKWRPQAVASEEAVLFRGLLATLGLERCVGSQRR